MARLVPYTSLSLLCSDKIFRVMNRLKSSQTFAFSPADPIHCTVVELEVIWNLTSRWSFSLSRSQSQLGYFDIGESWSRHVVVDDDKEMQSQKIRKRRVVRGWIAPNLYLTLSCLLRVSLLLSFNKYLPANLVIVTEL